MARYKIRMGLWFSQSCNHQYWRNWFAAAADLLSSWLLEVHLSFSPVRLYWTYWDLESVIPRPSALHMKVSSFGLNLEAVMWIERKKCKMSCKMNHFDEHLSGSHRQPLKISIMHFMSNHLKNKYLMFKKLSHRHQTVTKFTRQHWVRRILVGFNCGFTIIEAVINHGFRLSNHWAFPESPLNIGMVTTLMTVPFSKLNPIGAAIAAFSSSATICFVIRHFHGHFGGVTIFADQFAFGAQCFLQVVELVFNSFIYGFLRAYWVKYETHDFYFSWFSYFTWMSGGICYLLSLKSSTLCSGSLKASMLTWHWSQMRRLWNSNLCSSWFSLPTISSHSWHLTILRAQWSVCIR